ERNLEQRDGEDDRIAARHRYARRRQRRGGGCVHRRRPAAQAPERRAADPRQDALGHRLLDQAAHDRRERVVERRREAHQEGGSRQHHRRRRRQAGGRARRAGPDQARTARPRAPLTMALDREIEARFSKLGGVFLTPVGTLHERVAGIRGFVSDWDGAFNDGAKGDSSASTYNEPDSMGTNLMRYALWRAHGSMPLA